MHPIIVSGATRLCSCPTPKHDYLAGIVLHLTLEVQFSVSGYPPRLVLGGLRDSLSIPRLGIFTATTDAAKVDRQGFGVPAKVLP